MTIDATAVADLLADKLIVAEVAFGDANNPRSRRDIAVLDAKADAFADAAITVFDLGLAPWGLREAARTFIAAAGPRPSASSSTALARWHAQVRGELALTLLGS